MDSKEETSVDTEWEEMKDLAVEQQQCFYECLSDCTAYEHDQHECLKQNIGFAIYGPPTVNEDTSVTQESHCYCKLEKSNYEKDITDLVNYDKEAEALIDKIYKQICKQSVKPDSETIYFNIIYIMIFRPKMEIKKKGKNKTKAKVKEEVKESKDKLSISALPIFKIWRNNQKDPNTTKNKEQEKDVSVEFEGYEALYIDTNGRVYKNWEDFTENVNLPQCTIVAPKDGFYQPDPSFPIVEDYSTVLIETMDSPACKLKTKIFKGMDIASTAVGVGAVGLSIAALVTPVGPIIAVTGLVAGGASGIWTGARSFQRLLDRNSHEESISLLDKDAFPHYLGITGTVFGLGAMGGSVAISNAAAHGMIIPKYAKIAFNTVQGGNIFLNGVGVVYQGYRIVDRYLIEGVFSFADTLYFATHLMFFAGTVINPQFADDIIKSTQGKILDDYRENLRNTRLRKKFNRVVNKSARRNTCKISENADVINYIRNRQQLQVDQPGSSRILDLKSNKTPSLWSFEKGKINVGGILLLEPVKFVMHLIRSKRLIENYPSNPSDSQNDGDNLIFDQLGTMLCDLLAKLYTSDDCPRSERLPLSPDFKPLIKEMGNLNIDEESLRKLFDITIKLMKRAKDKEDFLFLCFAYIWQYCTTNLGEWNIKSCYRMQSVSGCRILQKIIIVVSEAINMILENLYEGFLMYIDHVLHN